jgi:fructose PTS system EIIA component
MTTSIDDVINEDLITLDLQADDARGVIREMAATFERDGRVTDPNAYVDAVLAREQETGGTGMESGVAVPHAKSPGVARAGFAFGRSAAGVAIRRSLGRGALGGVDSGARAEGRRHRT